MDYRMNIRLVKYMQKTDLDNILLWNVSKKSNSNTKLINNRDLYTKLNEIAKPQRLYKRKRCIYEIAWLI